MADRTDRHRLEGLTLRRVERSSRLSAPAEQVWAEATDLGMINGELMPLMSMTMPPRVRGLALEDFPVGVAVGKSRIRLFGFLPVDYDDFCLAELEPPRRFLERSSTLNFRVWEHERVIEPDLGGGCVLTDRLGFELKSPMARVPGAAAIAQATVSALFGHRHRRLRRRDRNRDTPGR